MELFHVEVDDDITVIRAEGGIDGRTADGFRHQMERLVDGGARRIVLDCSDLEIVSSAGLAALLRINARMRLLDGQVRLAGVQGAIAQVMQITRLDRVFEMHADVGRAKLAFRGQDA